MERIIDTNRGPVGAVNLGAGGMNCGKRRIDDNGFREGETSNPDFWGIDHYYLVTPTDAERLGLEYPKPAPAAVKCQFCGAELEVWGNRNPLDGRRVQAWRGTMKCTCEQAVRYWKAAGCYPFRPYERCPVHMSKLSATREMLEAQGVPALYSDAKAEGLAGISDAVRAIIAKYRSKDSLVITSVQGNADTRQRMAAAALRAAIDSADAPMARWITEADIADKDSKIDDSVILSKLLVLAEIGVMHFTSYGFGRLYDCVAFRYEQSLPTIYTTPQDGLTGLAAKWAESGSREQVDRLIEILIHSATMI